MKIIFVHHANRKKQNPPSANDDITKIGKKDAKNLAKLFTEKKKLGENFVAIYTPSTLRHTKTASILNKNLGLPIILDERFREYDNKEETFLQMQKRIRNALHEIVKKYNTKDTVICITSGVNIVAFISLAYKLSPSKDCPIIGVPNCCPLIFNITQDNFTKK